MNFLFLNAFCVLFVEISISQTNDNCLVSFNRSTLRKSDGKLIAGYNDVLGPEVYLKYDDTSLLLSACITYSYFFNYNILQCSYFSKEKDKLYPQALRHPGNTNIIPSYTVEQKIISTNK